MTLNQICRMTTKPDMLNALHACRKGHPLNATAVAPWFNAYALACQQASWIFDGATCDWLLAQSVKHGERLSSDD